MKPNPRGLNPQSLRLEGRIRFWEEDREEDLGQVERGHGWDAGWGDAHESFPKLREFENPLEEVSRLLRDRSEAFHLEVPYWRGWRQAYQELESLLLRASS